MPEKETITVEIGRKATKVDVFFYYNGPESIHIDEVYDGDESIDDLDYDEIESITEAIRAKKEGQIEAERRAAV